MNYITSNFSSSTPHHFAQRHAMATPHPRFTFHRAIARCTQSLAVCALASGLLLGQPIALAQAKAGNDTSAAAPNAGLASVAQQPGVSAEASSLQQPTAEAPASNPYGLGSMWLRGDWVAKLTLVLLTLMSVVSWYVLVRKTIELRKLKSQTALAHTAFNSLTNFGTNITKLSADNPLRYVADSGQEAARNFISMKPRVDYDTWLIRAIEQALSKLQTRMQDGMAVLATIGSTAPFVGLFGTVWAIYTALVQIGASGQASIDRVAGPVGEALIMTAIGLAVAVPAVFGYNWLLRKNKMALESVRSFGAKLHMVLLSSQLTEGAKSADAANASSKQG
jgi:biopolymer transport protein ExbB